MLKQMITSTVVLLFVGLLGYGAAASRSDSPSRAEDRAQIDKLMWRYSRALEGQKPDTYAALYAPDGQFVDGTGDFKGREAIEKMFADLKHRQAEAEAKRQMKKPAYVIHLNGYLDFPDRDHAHMEGYWLEFSARTGNTPPTVVGVGREVDELERANGQWLIKSRDVAPKD
ncbi:MAG: nuclear transport factor 2 family protein [Acidobacteriota bacterium]|nr:nuclear transport factor 2 family protein [Acidobacteriota bacterium]